MPNDGAAPADDVPIVVAVCSGVGCAGRAGLRVALEDEGRAACDAGPPVAARTVEFPAHECPVAGIRATKSPGNKKARAEARAFCLE